MNNPSNEKDIAPRRNEAKRKTDMEKNFKETINKATFIFRLVKRRPDLWC